MKNFNRITVTGNAGSDPDMRYTPSGSAVTTFSLANNQGYGDNQKTIWFRIKCWNKLAESVNQYVEKGKALLVDGRLSVDEWEGQDGKHTTVEITANDVIFLSSPKQETQEDKDFL